MAIITEATRELLRQKILEKSQDKRDALVGEIKKLADCIDAEADKMKAKAIDSIKKEFDTFNKNVASILKGCGLKWRLKYSYDYTVNDIIDESCGKAYIKSNAGAMFERINDGKDAAANRLDNLRIDIEELDRLEELDRKRKKACDDIELRVALGAKFDEVMELINNLQF